MPTSWHRGLHRPTVFPELRDNPSHVGYGWTLASGRCRPVCHIRQALRPGLNTATTLQAGNGSSGNESESGV